MGQREIIRSLLDTLPYPQRLKIEAAGASFRRSQPIDIQALWDKCYREWKLEGPDGRERREVARKAYLGRLLRKLGE